MSPCRIYRIILLFYRPRGNSLSIIIHRISFLLFFFQLLFSIFLRYEIADISEESSFHRSKRYIGANFVPFCDSFPRILVILLDRKLVATSFPCIVFKYFRYRAKRFHFGGKTGRIDNKFESSSFPRTFGISAKSSRSSSD